ncbi:MAG: DNA-binding protein [Romboutsia sp.]
MKFKERIDTFLELQNKDVDFENIAKQLEVSVKTLRSFLNRRGYKLENGKYMLQENVDIKENKVNQIVFDEVKKTKKVLKSKPKKDKKINITQEDIDKLCEVYDWYLEVKDYKNMKPKKMTSKIKDVNVENTTIDELKSTTIKIDKNVWEDFERLCSNSDYNKTQIITQALKEFIKEYRHLI